MKIGDIVRCTNNYVTDKCVTVHALTVGKEYEILATDGEYIDVKNDQGHVCAYYRNRFELVNKENEEVSNMSNEFIVGGRAICIDASDADCITEGKVYEVLYTGENVIRIIDDWGESDVYSKDRFNPIKTVDEATTITTDELQVKDSEGSTTLKVESDRSLEIIDASSQIIQLPVHVNVLGTTYTIEVIPVEEDSYLENLHGYCDFLVKSIVLREVKPTDYFGNIDAINAQYKTNLRHELMHAFLYESGLDSSTLDGWARNEEMIDFMALQLPKIFKAFNECGITE